MLNMGVENIIIGVENKNILRNISLIHKIVVNLCRIVKARPQSCRETSSFHYDRVGSLRRTTCSESPRGWTLCEVGLGREKLWSPRAKKPQSKRPCELSKSQLCLSSPDIKGVYKRQVQRTLWNVRNFEKQCTALNMTTVDVPGVIIPSCHILHEQVLCSATMAYNILGLCKWAIIAIYHIGVGYTVVRSAV